ncbi:peptidase domain-containing ABC transporter [Sagittula sp. NFXS13]|uniref:peptidase domain-containing ABC transporter n=1 Tax=Sagittula sp. NFXS13 TaxID=2819095 RepID=UPI0032DEDA1B
MTQHTGIRCLCLAGREHGVDLGPERLVHDHALGKDEPAPRFLARIGRENGLKVRPARTTFDRLFRLKPVWPLIGVLSDGRYVLFIGADPEKRGLRVLDPARRRAEIETWTVERAADVWDGQVLFVKAADPGAQAESNRFGLGYFLSEMGRSRGVFATVALIAMVMHGLNLAVPIFFQIVMDKVLQNGALPTLYILTWGMVLLLILTAALGYFRARLLLLATNRIDIRVSTRIFAKLVSLPLDYFETRSAGVTAKHASQHTAIRNFLTGRLFGTLMDLSALIVFIPVLAAYSGKMTLIVLGYAVLISLVMLAVLRPYHSRLQELYTTEGERQSLLIETLNGIETTKALALEPPRRRRWDAIAARVVNRGLEVGRIGAISGEATRLLEKLMTVTLVFVGIQLVLKGELTVGALIAFNMLSQRVSGPLVQAVSLIQDYQEVRISVKMLGQIMDRPSEQRRARGLTPPIRGAVMADDLSFSYPNGVKALSGIDFSIRAGEFIGIVGRSGSGKSTLTRLLQGFYLPESGSLRFDNVDMRQIELPHLRTAMSVVPQASFLYRGTIAENIRITRPDATLEEVIEAARQAGAAEFVDALPEGYDTVIEENGSNLSGGQRQRVSIARALLREPRIVIMDEATSALDPESEAVVMENLPAMRRGRTILMVTHRLGQLVDADRIMVMDGGQIVDFADHKTLLEGCELYRSLWNRQYGRISGEVRYGCN